MPFKIMQCSDAITALVARLTSASTPAAEKTALCDAIAANCPGLGGGTGGGTTNVTNNYYVAPLSGTSAPTTAPTATQAPYYVQLLNSGPYVDFWTYLGTSWVKTGTTVPEPIQTAITAVTENVVVGSRLEIVRTVGTGRITGARAFLHTAGTSGNVTVDVRRNGASVMSALITIDANELTSLTGSLSSAIAGGSFTYLNDDELSFHVMSTSTGAKGLYVTLVHG